MFWKMLRKRRKEGEKRQSKRGRKQKKKMNRKRKEAMNVIMEVRSLE